MHHCIELMKVICFIFVFYLCTLYLEEKTEKSKVDKNQIYGVMINSKKSYKSLLRASKTYYYDHAVSCHWSPMNSVKSSWRIVSPRISILLMRYWEGYKLIQNDFLLTRKIYRRYFESHLGFFLLFSLLQLFH